MRGERHAGDRLTYRQQRLAADHYICIFLRMETVRDAAARPQWRALCGDEEIGRAHYLDAAMALARIHAGAPLEWTADIANMGSIATLRDGRVYRVEPSGPRDVA